MDKSIWSDTVEMPRFPVQKGNIKTDVLIVGGGLAGLLCAFQLSRAGVNYTLIEADRICDGVTANTTAKLTSQHGLIYSKLLDRFGLEIAKGYWQANEKALAQYKTLARQIDCDFEEKENFIYGTQEESKLEEEMRALDRLGIPSDFCATLDIPVPVCGAIRFSGQAQFHPLKFAAKIAEGLNILEGTKALEFAGNSVKTNRGMIRADKIIVATHFPILNKHGAYYLKQYQSRSYELALENAASPAGMYLGIDGKKLSFRSWGDYLLLGGGGHRTGKKTDGWNGLEHYARINYPQGRIARRWATQDCMTLDDIPYIGRYGKQTADLYVATGFNKWGMTSSMVAAEILVDLMQGKENAFGYVFAPQRSSFHPQLFINGFETAYHLLMPAKPRCPHMGCAMQWNPQERSWDCPCHGSRFSENGKLLNNPATDDLKRKN